MKRRKVKRRSRAPRGVALHGYTVEECGKLVSKTYPTLQKARKAAKKAPEAVIRSKETGHFVNKDEGKPAETPEVTKARECPVAPPKPKRIRNERAKDAVGGLIGQMTTVLTTAGNCLKQEPAHYRLTSIARLCPSHDGLSFKRNACYPSGTQERRYGKDRGEQNKVISNAQASCFEPAVVANTDPTPLGGPPIVTSSGIVLGGNSRAMVLQRVWEKPEGPAAKEYRRYLARHAPCWGFDEADVATTELPVLVRVLDKVKGTQKDAVRRYNEGLTQELGVTEAQVATSARIDSAIIAELENMGEEETLSSFLQSQRSAGLVRLLRAKDVITRQQVSKYIGKNGLLNEDGRRFLSRALVGKLLPNADELDLLTPSIRESLARAVPYFLRAAEVGPKWDIRSAMPDATRLYSAVKAAKRPLAIYLNQRGLFDAGVRVTTATVLLAQILLDRSGPIQLSSGARRYAASARGTMTIDLFGEQASPIDSLAAAFSLKPIAGAHVEKVSTFLVGKPATPKPPPPKPAKKQTAPPEKQTAPPEKRTAPARKQTAPIQKAGSPEHKAKMAKMRAELEAEDEDIKKSAAKLCYLPSEWRDSEWGLYYVDLHSGNHEYDRRECIASKKTLRWVVTGVARVGDGLLHALYWYGTKAEANKKDAELRRNEDGKRWPYKGAGPDYISLKVRQVKHAKSGDARTDTKKVSPAKAPAAAKTPAGITKELAKALGMKEAKKTAPAPKSKDDRPPMWPYYTGAIVNPPSIKVAPFLWLDHKNYGSILYRKRNKKGPWKPWRAYKTVNEAWDETADWNNAHPEDEWREVVVEPIDKRARELFTDKGMMVYRPTLPKRAIAFVDKGKPKAPLKLETSKAPKVAPPPPPPKEEKPKEAARLAKEERGAACELLSQADYLAGYRIYYVDVVDYAAIRKEKDSKGPTPMVRICYLSTSRIKWVVTAMDASDVNAYLWTTNKKVAEKKKTELRNRPLRSNVKVRQVQEDKRAWNTAKRRHLETMKELKGKKTSKAAAPSKLKSKEVHVGKDRGGGQLPKAALVLIGPEVVPSYMRKKGSIMVSFGVWNEAQQRLRPWTGPGKAKATKVYKTDAGARRAIADWIGEPPWRLRNEK